MKKKPYTTSSSSLVETVNLCLLSCLFHSLHLFCLSIESIPLHVFTASTCPPPPPPPLSLCLPLCLCLSLSPSLSLSISVFLSPSIALYLPDISPSVSVCLSVVLSLSAYLSSLFFSLLCLCVCFSLFFFCEIRLANPIIIDVACLPKS